jgi:hypothetical protein
VPDAAWLLLCSCALKMSMLCFSTWFCYCHTLCSCVCVVLCCCSQVLQQLNNTRALHVNGKKILAWAQHMMTWIPNLPEEVQERISIAGPETIQFYEQLDGVPDAWVKQVIVPNNEEEARFLRHCHLTDRTGYTETRVGSHADPKVRTPLPSVCHFCLSTSCTFQYLLCSYIPSPSTAPLPLPL